MKKKLQEQSVLLASVSKWFFLATVTGCIVGVFITGFIKALHWAITQAGALPFFLLLVPFGFLASAWLVQTFAPEAEGHGTEKVIQAIHLRAGKIPIKVVPVKLLATIVTLACGGSAGKEGPCAQIGGGLCSFFSDLFRFGPHDRKKLVICGISAGFAAVFGTPIAGAIFGIEVLFVGTLLYDVLLPSFVAGIVGYQVSSALGLTYFYLPVNFLPEFSEAFFLKVALSGVFFGLCAFLLIEIMNLGRWVSHKLPLPHLAKAFLAGSVLAGVGFFISTQYLGLGLENVQATLEGNAVSWYSPILKSLCTSLTLNFGGSGGMITPVFFIGAGAGSLFASLFGLSVATFSAIGMVSVLAGGANTPIAASIMAVELFGPKVAPYAAVACVISFLMTGHRSIYPSQVLAVKKSASFDIELGKEIEGVQAGIPEHAESFFRRVENVTKKVGSKFRRGPS